MRRANNGKGGLDASEAAAQGIGSGVVRAQTLASGKSIPLETVKRMRSFFARHEKNKHGPNGKVAWALWGGDAGKRWADSIVAQHTEKSMEKAMNAHQKQVAREVHGDEVSSSVPGHSEEETSSPAIPDRMVQANPRVLEQGHDTPMHDPITKQQVMSLGEESDGLAISHRGGTHGASTMADQQFAAGSPGPGRLEGEYDPTQHIALVIARIGSGVDTMLHMHKSQYDMSEDLLKSAKDGDLEKGKFGRMAAGVAAAGLMAGAGARHSADAEKVAPHARAAEVTGKQKRNLLNLKRERGQAGVNMHAAVNREAHPASKVGTGELVAPKPPKEAKKAEVVAEGFGKSKKSLAKSLAEFLINDAIGSRRGNIRRSYTEKFPNAVAVLEYQLSKAMSGEVKLHEINVTQADLLDATKAITGKDLTKSVDHVLRRRAEDTLAARMDAPEDLLYVRRVMKHGI
jgi:hypothetical protein